MTNKPRIAVLLATHHPNAYVLEQINSIKLQEKVEPIVYWGDFQSTHTELKIVSDALNGLEHKAFTINKAGPAANFFELLQKCNEAHIAFADQDDIWLPTKHYHHFQILEQISDMPALVHSNSLLMRGTKINRKRNICRGHSFDDMAFSNCCQGCTMMINQKAKREILRSLPDNIVWHDWWIALVVSLTGQVLFTKEADTIYRLHETNTIGLPTKYESLLRFLKRPRGLVQTQINHILRIFQNHPEILANSREYRGMLSNNLVKRFTFLLLDRKRKANIIDDIVRRLLWIFKLP